MRPGEKPTGELKSAAYVSEGGISRITRDDMFLDMCELTAKRSTCTRRHVGALIVMDKRPISMGYNGAPPGLPHCLDVGCKDSTVEVPNPSDVRGGSMVTRAVEGCSRAIHAEANAIAFAARHGVPTADATLYSTDSPCQKCAELILAAGIARVVYRREYRIKEPIYMLKEAGVTVDHD